MLRANEAQDERRGFAIIEDLPFMLRHSKHSEAFLSNPLGTDKCRLHRGPAQKTFTPIFHARKVIVQLEAVA